MTFLYANNAAGTLAAGVAAGDLSLTLNAGQAAAFPVPTTLDTFFATITDALTQSFVEIVLVTNVSGNVFSITRGQDGTSPRSWSANDIVSLRIVAAQARRWDASVIPSGFIGLWSGAANAVPEGWLLCNGTNGTPDLRNRFVVGAGDTYAVGANGGLVSNTLSIAQLPAHNHSVTDPGHAHSISDPSHNHSVNDPGHVHGAPTGGFYTTSPSGYNYSGGGSALSVSNTTSSSITGISLNASATGIGINAALTGITTQNTGTGAPVENRPPYYALCYIMKA